MPLLVEIKTPIKIPRHLEQTWSLEAAERAWEEARGYPPGYARECREADNRDFVNELAEASSALEKNTEEMITRMMKRHQHKKE